jgi:hypothetical protein
MAVSVSTGTNPGRNHAPFGSRPHAHLRLTFDSSYPTGGEAVDFKRYAGFTPAVVWFSQRAPTTGAYNFVYSGGTIRVFWVDTTVDGAAMAEVANTTNLSTLVVDVLLLGD